MTTLFSTKAHGVYPISITPFTDSGAVDYEGLDRLTDFFQACRVPGITLLGVLGEANKLSHEESIAVVRRVIKRAGDALGVIVGAGHVGFENFQQFTDAVMSEGAAAIMVSPASGLKTEEQVHGYFDGLIGHIGPQVPLVLQDYPQNSGVFLSVGTLGRLLARHESIKVVKHEEGSALRKITRLRAQESAGERSRVSILVGNSGIHLPQELHRGADGANTGVAYPEMLVEVCDRFFAGNAEGGEDLYDIFLPLVRHEQQPGIGLAIRKEIFRRRGLIQSARVRAPGPALDADDHAELARLLDRLSRRLRAAGEDSVITTYAIPETNR